jgi:hypothetical protein
MKKPVLAVAIVCGLALAMAGSLAAATEGMDVHIPVSFVVNQKEMPAGDYVIEPTGEHMDRLIVKGSRAIGLVVTPVLERLADMGSVKPWIVFDRLKGKYYLSEVHYPGMDGFLVGIVGGKETHEVLKGTTHKQ